jgi:hypothetical protein
LIIAWREMELPTNEQVDEAVKTTLAELNLSNCQAAKICRVTHRFSFSFWY